VSSFQAAPPVDLDNLRVCVATPTTDRRVLVENAAFVSQCFLERLIKGHTYESGSSVNHARNKITARIRGTRTTTKAGKSVPFTHILSVDGDVFASTEHVRKLYEHAHRGGIHCAAYPIKTDTLKYCYNTFDGRLEIEPDTGLAEIPFAGAGFMLIPMAIIEHMIAEWQELEYIDDHTRKPAWALWDTQVVEVAPGYRRFLPEDFLFCHRARLLGYKVWLQTGFIVNHIGDAVYPTPAQHARRDLEEQIERLGHVPYTRQDAVRAALASVAPTG
jgi:hypothetical protein